MPFKRNINKNAFPIKLIDNCIKSFLNKRRTEKPVTLTAEKKNLDIVKVFLYHLMKPSEIKMKCHYLFTYLINPSYMKSYFNGIYYCYCYCINITIVS